MGVQERRLRDKQRRVKEIIDAAEKVLFAKGIQNATMDDIAKEAELGKATLYEYYASKDEIFLAIQERASNLLAKAFEKAIEKHNLGYDKIKAIGEAYFAFAREFPNYYQFISLFEATNTKIDPEKSAQNMLKVNEVMHKAIGIGMADGSIRKDMRPDVLSKVLWAVSTGILQMIDTKGEMLEKYQNIKPEDLFACFFDLLKDGAQIGMM